MPLGLDESLMDLRLALTAAWTAGGVALCVIKPEAAPFFLPLALVAPLLWSQRNTVSNRLLPVSWLSVLLALTSAYLLVNAGWSTMPTRAYVAAIIFLVLSFVLHVLFRTVPDLDRRVLRAMAIGFYAGYAVCAFLVSIEIAFDHPLHVATFRTFPLVAPDTGGMVYHEGLVQSVPSFFLNRNVAMLLLLTWPALLVAYDLSASPRARTLLFAALSPALPAILLSDHQSSKVAITGGALVLLLASFAPRLAKPLLITAWVIACTAALPLASLAYDLQLHRSPWLQMSAQHRIVIWAVASEKALDAPLLGHGMVSAREIGKKQAASAEYAPGTTFPLASGPHAHNIYLEAWFDTGAVGVALLLSLGIASLLRIATLSAEFRPVFYAMFSSIALLAASSFSLWSRWFIAAFGVSIIYALLAWSFSRSRPSDDAVDERLPETGELRA